MPATPGSVLANSIRKLEEANHQGRTMRVKIVEKTGSTLMSSLTNKTPWGTNNCGEEDSLLCISNPSSNISCRTPGMGYIISCTICSGNDIVAKYQGETGKCLYVRGSRHLYEFYDGLKTNLLVIHNETHHNGSKVPNFMMRATRPFMKSMDRQIDESIRIKYLSEAKDQQIIFMNSGSEWRGDPIPRAAFHRS